MKLYCLEVTGDFACFTRPEMKVERVSYDLITPSAARAVFESILWKPAIRWHLRTIEVLRPIRWISLRRNEVGGVVSTRNVDDRDAHRQRRPGALDRGRPPARPGSSCGTSAYRLHADLEFRRDADPQASPLKYQEMFERRAQKGQCVNQPYLGCREFAADFRLIAAPDQEPLPIDDSRDLGFMLYDLDFGNPADPQPRFFRAAMNNGVVQVPAWDSAEVRG